jgi:phosphoglycolate phosphatase-like HAD superfamily hydrolase
MHLVIFDVDGTLTDTMAVDAYCFLRAFTEVCGFSDVESDWSSYSNATDAGIFHEVFELRLGRAPSPTELAHFREHLVALFRAAAATRPFDPVRGAPELLARLKQENDYSVALATGCWADSARVKMSSAGMCYDDYPSASADEAPERDSILKLALARAAGSSSQKLSGVLYVGDGVWDIRACGKAGIPFLGIAAGVQKEKLIAAGATHVLPDFFEQDQFFASIESILAI